MNITITGSAFLSNVGTLQNRHLAPIEVILAHKPLDPGRGGAIYCHGSRVIFRYFLRSRFTVMFSVYHLLLFISPSALCINFNKLYYLSVLKQPTTCNLY